MAATLMHMFRMNILPFCQHAPYRSPVKWLELNKSIIDYIESEKPPLFIRDWGTIRAHGRARMFEHRIWRRVVNMASRKNFTPENIHLVPLQIVPNYKLVMDDPSVQVRRFFINLTPHVISSHVVLEINQHDLSRPLSQFENLICTVRKGDTAKPQTISNLLKWVDSEMLKKVLDDCSPDKLDKLNSVWHTSFAIPEIQLDANTALQIFRKNGGVDRFAQPLIYDAKISSEEPCDWNIIDKRRSIMSLFPKKVYSARYEEERWRKLICHFNNWNDLLFVYFSIYSSLQAARSFIDSGNKIHETAFNRLMACYEVYEKLSTESGWRQEIELFEKSYTGESLLHRLREDIKPRKGDIMIVIKDSSGVIVNVAEYMSNVSNHVNNSIHQSNESDEVKKLVKQLTEQITAIANSTNSNNASNVQQMGEDLKTLSNEMAKPKPRSAWYDISLKGIKEAATAIGEIAKPVVDTVCMLMKLLVL